MLFLLIKMSYYDNKLQIAFRIELIENAHERKASRLCASTVLTL